MNYMDEYSIDKPRILCEDDQGCSFYKYGGDYGDLS